MLLQLSMGVRGPGVLFHSLLGRLPGLRDASRERLLSEVSHVIYRTLDLDETLLAVGRCALPALGDFCIIDLVEEDGAIRRVAAVHASGHEPEMAVIAASRPDEPDRPTWRVIQSGLPFVLRGAPETLLPYLGGDPALLEMADVLHPSGITIMPMLLHDRTVGALTFVMTGRRRLTDEHVALAREVADRAAVAVANAQAHELVERMATEARAVADRREELLAIATHEARGPLTSILGYAQRIESQARTGAHPVDAETLARVEEIVAASRRLGRTIEQFLGMARVESPSRVFQPRPVDLRRVMESEANALAERYPHARISSRLPEGELVLDTSEDRVRLVISNLLENAAKYGGDPPEVMLTLEETPAGVTARIRDNGAGIPPEERERIFEPRHRGLATEYKPGLGIGLYLARRSVEDLGGELTFSTEPGRGSEFVLTLPRTPPAAQPIAGAAARL